MAQAASEGRALSLHAPFVTRGSVILRACTTAGTRSVSDPASARSARASTAAGADKRGFFERLVEMISPGPDSKAELIRILAGAEDRELIEPESRLMLEGVLRMADMSAGDVMVPTQRMDLLDINADYDELLALVIDRKSVV